jgi:site-specific DNA recombinase
MSPVPTPKPPKPRCAVYARISNDRQMQREGVQNQQKACLALARRNGWRVVRIYEDNDTGASSRSRKPRPAYDEMLAAAKGGQIDHVLAYSTSRLTRRPRQLEDWLELHEARKVSVHFVTGPASDWTSTQGRAVARTLAAWDAAEAETTGDRVAFAAEAAAQRGERSGGPRQFGYGRTTVVQLPDGTARRRDSRLAELNPEEAAAIKIAFERKIKGDSDRSIWREWNDKGLRTARGNPWCGSSFREMLKSPQLAGFVVYAGKIAVDDNGKPVKSSWPAIVDVETWRAVQAILSDPARKTSPGTTPKHLCSGIARCGKCGATLRSSVGWSNGTTKVKTYRCTREGCGVTVFRDKLDRPVRQAIIDAFAAGEPLRGTDDDADDTARRTLEIALDENRAAEARLAEAIADGLVSREAARIKSTQIKADREKVAADLRAIEQRSAKSAMLAATTAEFLSALPTDRPACWGDPEHEAELVSWLHLRTYERHEGLSRANAVKKVVAAVHADELRSRFDALPLEQQRNLVRSLLRITVMPGRGQDRVRIERP